MLTLSKTPRWLKSVIREVRRTEAPVMPYHRGAPRALMLARRAEPLPPAFMAAFIAASQKRRAARG
jgi:hypothetical protein